MSERRGSRRAAASAANDRHRTGPSPARERSQRKGGEDPIRQVAPIPFANRSPWGPPPHTDSTRPNHGITNPVLTFPASRYQFTDSPVAQPSGNIAVSCTAALTSRPGFYARVGKGIFDRVVGIVLLVVIAPIMAVVAIMIRLILGRGTIYVQDRVGLNGEIFKMYKFRTMRVDRRCSNQSFPLVDRRERHKSLNDPRHTSLGRWLRRRSLDELPQLWNVVRGDMSLVGPRPELPSVVCHYEPWQHLRHLVKPGLTGLWQTTVRNREDGSLLRDHTDLDLTYIRRMSFRVDLRMILATITVVCRIRPGGS